MSHASFHHMTILAHPEASIPGDMGHKFTSNDDPGRVYQNPKCFYPRGRSSCAKAWPYNHLDEMHYFCKDLLLKINFGIKQ